MKHHKVKGAWRHRPDALPLPDAPSTGAKRKKGPLEKASKKHLWDLLHQDMKKVRAHSDWLWLHQDPTGFFYLHMAEWACEDIEKRCRKMEEVVLELERRME